MNLFLTIAFVLFTRAIAISQQVSVPDKKPLTGAINTKEVLTYNIINSYNNTYGYDIFKNGKLLIHQPSIPALQGNDGFKTKIAAEKIAELVISKIKKGKMPPSITIDELKELKVMP